MSFAYSKSESCRSAGNRLMSLLNCLPAHGMMSSVTKLIGASTDPFRTPVLTSNSSEQPDRVRTAAVDLLLPF